MQSSVAYLLLQEYGHVATLIEFDARLMKRRGLDVSVQARENVAVIIGYYKCRNYSRQTAIARLTPLRYRARQMTAIDGTKKTHASLQVQPAQPRARPSLAVQR